MPPPVAGSARASDGDSFHLGPDRVRLLGIDAPELDQTCSRADGTDWNCGREARDRMAELLAGGSVTCLPQGDDQYGRLLAHCTAAGTDIGAEMVEAGLAIGRGEYGREESAARNAKRGIWQGRFVSPREWRDQGPQSDPEWGPIEQGWNWLRELTGARPLR